MLDQLGLIQRSFFFPALTIQTTTDGKLLLQSKGLLRSRSQTYSLDEIDPAPIHERAFAAGWALGAGAAIAAVGVRILEAIFQGSPGVGFSVFFWFFGVISVSPALDAVWMSSHL